MLNPLALIAATIFGLLGSIGLVLLFAVIIVRAWRALREL